MLSTNQFKLKYPDLFSSFKSLIMNKSKFPCIHAQVSLSKELMYFGVSSSGDENFNKLANDLTEMSNFLNNYRTDDEKSFNTYIYIINNHEVSNVTIFLLSLLQSLHELDTHKWPSDKTKDMNRNDFEFHFNGNIWVPILLTKHHPTLMRRSPFTLVSFQPEKTFSYNKKTKTERYKKIRISTHRKIDRIYNYSKPFYLSSKSSGNNIVQYIGLDMKEFNNTYTYPILK